MTATQNRRAFVRGREHGAYAKFPGGACSIRNFSVGGLMLDDEDPLQVGSEIRLELCFGPEVLYANGVVRRSEPGTGMAVQFTPLPLPTRQRLLQFVERACAEESRQKLAQQLESSVREYRTGGPQPTAPGKAAPVRPGQPMHLANILLRIGMVTEEQLAVARAQQHRSGGSLITALVSLNIVREEELVRCFQREFRIPAVDLSSTQPTSQALKLVPYEMASRHSILPIGVAGASLTVAVSDPANVDGLQQVKFASGCDLRVTVAPARTLQRLIDRAYLVQARSAG